MKSNHIEILRRPVLIWCILGVVSLITSCSNDSSPVAEEQFSLLTDTINFVAETPSVYVAPQTITATVSKDLKGFVSTKTEIDGNAIWSVGYYDGYSPDHMDIDVEPVYPSTLGVGTHTSFITIHACLNDSSCATGELSGSPKTVKVNYIVKSPVKADSVMPYIAVANQSGDVILRGANLSNVKAVGFGANNAANFTVVSDTEIHATYPALAEGKYPIELHSDSDIIPFSADLIIVAPTTYTAATLSFSPEIIAVTYDAE